ncbi:MAG: 50S ribosomal protein L36 [Chloroflexi bacterium]|nr:MAG: 50S ribosomal protein L36 [Chloroflexota bacterium]
MKVRASVKKICPKCKVIKRGHAQTQPEAGIES